MNTHYNFHMFPVPTHCRVWCGQDLKFCQVSLSPCSDRSVVIVVIFTVQEIQLNLGKSEGWALTEEEEEEDDNDNEGETI